MPEQVTLREMLLEAARVKGVNLFRLEEIYNQIIQDQRIAGGAKKSEFLMPVPYDRGRLKEAVAQTILAENQRMGRQYALAYLTEDAVLMQEIQEKLSRMPTKRKNEVEKELQTKVKALCKEVMLPQILVHTHENGSIFHFTLSKKDDEDLKTLFIFRYADLCEMKQKAVVASDPERDEIIDAFWAEKIPEWTDENRRVSFPSLNFCPEECAEYDASSGRVRSNNWLGLNHTHE